MFFTRLNRIPRSFPDVNPVFTILLYFLCHRFLCTGGLPPNPITCSIIRILQLFVKPDLIVLFPDCFLFLRKSCTGRLSAIAGTTALNVHMIRHTLVIAVIDALYRLAVDADGFAGMGQGTGKGITSLSLLCKAFTAGTVTVAGMLAAYHDVSLAAQTILIIGTIFHNTL